MITFKIYYNGVVKTYIHTQDSPFILNQNKIPLIESFNFIEIERFNSKGKKRKPKRVTNFNYNLEYSPLNKLNLNFFTKHNSFCMINHFKIMVYKLKVKFFNMYINFNNEYEYEFLYCNLSNYHILTNELYQVYYPSYINEDEKITLKDYDYEKRFDYSFDSIPINIIYRDLHKCKIFR